MIEPAPAKAKVIKQHTRNLLKLEALDAFDCQLGPIYECDWIRCFIDPYESSKRLPRINTIKCIETLRKGRPMKVIIHSVSAYCTHTQLSFNWNRNARDFLYRHRWCRHRHIIYTYTPEKRIIVGAVFHSLFRQRHLINDLCCMLFAWFRLEPKLK